MRRIPLPERNRTGQAERSRGLHRQGSADGPRRRLQDLVVTVVPDDLKDAAVHAIIEAARSPGDGRIGDGKIIVSRVEDVIRVRTGEHGETAL